MKKVRRILFLSFMVVASILVLAACSKNDNGSKETTDGNQKTTTTKAEQTTIKEESTTDMYTYDMVGEDKTIVLPTEDITKIRIQVPESELLEYQTVTDLAKIKNFVNGIKKMTFIKGDTKNLATGSSMVVDLYYNEKDYMRISVLGKQAFITTGDGKVGYFETNDYSVLESLVNAAL